MAPLDFALVRHALNLAKNAGMDEVDLEIGESKFHAVLDEKAKKPAPSPKAAAPTKAEAAASKVKTVKSHNVGIFREHGHVVKVDDIVAVGDVLGSVIALGISNDIVSTVQGRVVEVNVVDGEAVEYGQILVVLEAE